MSTTSIIVCDVPLCNFVDGYEYFIGNLLLPFLSNNLKIQTRVNCYETGVNYYQTIQCYIPEDNVFKNYSLVFMQVY